jgi:hypothetical protein
MDRETNVLERLWKNKSIKPFLYEEAPTPFSSCNISRRGREETLTPNCTLLCNGFEFVDLNEVAHKGNTPSIEETLASLNEMC